MLKKKITKNRLSIRLSVGFCTGALLTSFLGCTPFSNDESKDVTPGTESAFDPSGAPGTLSKHLLSGQHFRSMTVEILPVIGFQPYQQSLNYLYVFLSKYLTKPGGIQIVVDPAINTPAHPAGQSGYTVNDVKKIESTYRKNYTTKGHLAVFILYADWDSNDDISSNKLLGEAYQNSSIVIFKNTIQALIGANPAINPYVIEGTVLDHEFGHLMGLVNENGIGSYHESTSSPRHCTVAGCLMDANVETSGVAGATTASAPPDLDSDCQADLKALADQ